MASGRNVNLEEDPVDTGGLEVWADDSRGRGGALNASAAVEA
jgi:hypothetical protein